MRLLSKMGLRVIRLGLILGIGFLVFLVFLVTLKQMEEPPSIVFNVGDLGAGPRTFNTVQVSNRHESYDTIDAHERLHRSFFFSGFTFDEKGRKSEIGADVTSCLLHSFSPYIEREASKRFLDPPHNNVYFANSPAIQWYKGELVLVSRIWLDREKYEAKKDWPPNHFADNWLYTQKFDSHMKPVSNGSLLGMPAPKQRWVGDGPIEPRLFKVQNRLFLSFNVAMVFENKKYMDFTVLWDYDQNVVIIPKIEGGSPMANSTEKRMPRDKHWMPLIQKDELYFVHNLDPLSVLHCNLAGHCEFVHQERPKDYVFDHHQFHLRGGTPFELYEWPYYVGIAHATLYKESNGHRHYSAHMVVVSVEPTYRVVYLSNEIQVDEEVFKLYPIVRYRYMDEGFIFPVGLIIEGRDVMNIGVHVSDHSSVIIRLRGVETLMQKIMKEDQRSRPTHGPPVHYLHEHVHDAMENETHRKYIHKDDISSD